MPAFQQESVCWLEVGICRVMPFSKDASTESSVRPQMMDCQHRCFPVFSWLGLSAGGVLGPQQLTALIHHIHSCARACGVMCVGRHSQGQADWMGQGFQEIWG